MLNKETILTFNEIQIHTQDFDDKTWFRLNDFFQLFDIPFHYENRSKSKQDSSTRRMIATTDCLGRPSRMVYLSIRGVLTFLTGLASDGRVTDSLLQQVFFWVRDEIANGKEYDKEDISSWIDLKYLVGFAELGWRDVHRNFEEYKKATQKEEIEKEIVEESKIEKYEKDANVLDEEELDKIIVFLRKLYCKATVQLPKAIRQLKQAEKEKEKWEHVAQENIDKVSMYDSVDMPAHLISSTILAQYFGIGSAQRLHKILEKPGILLKDKNGDWVIAPKYARDRYIQHYPLTYVDTNGDLQYYIGKCGSTRMHFGWTMKGKVWLYRWLKAHGFIEDNFDIHDIEHDIEDDYNFCDVDFGDLIF